MRNSKNFHKIFRNLPNHHHLLPSLVTAKPATCHQLLFCNIRSQPKKSSHQHIPARTQQHPLSRIGAPRLPAPNYQFSTNRSLSFQHMVANHFRNTINHIFDVQGKRQTLDQLIHGTDAAIWQQATSNELGRLAQGVKNTKGNDVIDFIYKSDVPIHKKVTYANMVCDFRPLKSEPYRVRLTVGGD